MNDDNSPSKIALIILILAILIRLSFNIFYVGINDTPVADAQDYHQIALSLLTTGIFPSVHRSPLLPFIIAFLYKIFGINYFVIRMVLTLLSAFTCLLIYKTAKELYDEQSALIAMFISAIYWMLFYPCGFLLTETLCTFFLTGAVFFLTKSYRIPHIRYFIFSGIYLGLAALTRAFIFPFFLFLPFWAYVSFKNNRKLTLKAFIVVTVTMFLVISPWTIRNYLVIGKFIPINMGGGGVFAGANNPEVLKHFQGGWIRPEKSSIFKEGEINWDKPIEAHSVCWKRGISFIVKNPLSTAKLVFYKFKLFWHLHRDTSLPSLEYFFVFLFAIYGSIISLRNFSRMSILYLLPLFFNSMILIFWGDDRIRNPIEPIFVIFAACGISQILKIKSPQ